MIAMRTMISLINVGRNVSAIATAFCRPCFCLVVFYQCYIMPALAYLIHLFLFCMFGVCSICCGPVFSCCCFCFDVSICRCVYFVCCLLVSCFVPVRFLCFEGVFSCFQLLVVRGF